jgi:hypothetical protein
MPAAQCWHDHHGGHRRVLHAEFVAVVAQRKERAAASVSVLIREIAVEILAAVVGGPSELVAREGWRRGPLLLVRSAQ